MTDVITAPTLRSQVAVIGGGIAGIWVALKLAGLGIDSVLVDYRADDRGGILGSSARSVVADVRERPGLHTSAAVPNTAPPGGLGTAASSWRCIGPERPVGRRDPRG